MAKTEKTVTFKTTEEFYLWLSDTTTQLDCSASEFIRCFCLLSADTIKNMPSLINRIQFNDRKNGDDNQ